MGSSALEEGLDALAAYLTTEFGGDTIDPSHDVQDLRITNPFRLRSYAEEQSLAGMLQSIRGVSLEIPDVVQASGRYIMIPGADLASVKSHVTAGLGGYRDRINFLSSAYVPVARILRDEAIVPAVSFVKELNLHRTLFFRGVVLRQLSEAQQAAA